MLLISGEPKFHSYDKLCFSPNVWDISELDVNVIQMINNIKYSMDIEVSKASEPIYGETYVTLNVVYDEFAKPRTRARVRITELNYHNDDVEVLIRVSEHGYQLFGVLDNRNRIIVQFFRMPRMYVIAKFTASPLSITDTLSLIDIVLNERNTLVYTDNGAYFIENSNDGVERFEIMDILRWERSLLNYPIKKWMEDTGITIVDRRVV